VVEALNIVMLAGLAVTAIAIARLRNLFAVTMLSGIYSLLSAGIFVLLDAVDVAFTEAAVGAGITTVLFLGTLILTDREAKPRQFRWQATAPLALVILMGIGLIYASLDPKMPHFGNPDAPANKRLVPEFMADAVKQTGRDAPTAVGIPNVVTTTLASYRGYDTLGETVVIFTAGIAVLILLGTARRRREDEEEAEADAGKGAEKDPGAGD
jgi:multicomponent Na+:H+ antiporter subunit B